MIFKVLPISLTITAASALLAIWLGGRCSAIRMKGGVPIGDGGDPRLAARMRAQLNFAEYVPVFLVLLALVELAKGSPLWLWGVGIVFILGRIAHMFGMDRASPNPLRAGGILTTWIAMTGLAVVALVIPYSH